MERGTVFRIDEPITEHGYYISAAKEEDYPLYGVMRGADFSVVYVPMRGQWRGVTWNWKPEHVAQFEEVVLD